MWEWIPGNRQKRETLPTPVFSLPQLDRVIFLHCFLFILTNMDIAAWGKKKKKERKKTFVDLACECKAAWEQPDHVPHS